MLLMNFNQSRDKKLKIYKVIVKEEGKVWEIMCIL